MDINPDRKRDWGRRVDVYWEGDGVYYRGTVTGYSTTSGKHTIMYDDGDVERVKLSDVSGFEWLDACSGDVLDPCPVVCKRASACGQGV
jgi:hypothetical protein